VDTVHECDRQTDRRTDGRTDGRTDRITITDTVQTASHGKNQLLLRDRATFVTYEYVHVDCRYMYVACRHSTPIIDE